MPVLAFWSVCGADVGCLFWCSGLFVAPTFSRLIYLSPGLFMAAAIWCLFFWSPGQMCTMLAWCRMTQQLALPSAEGRLPAGPCGQLPPVVGLQLQLQTSRKCQCQHALLAKIGVMHLP